MSIKKLLCCVALLSMLSVAKAGDGAGGNNFQISFIPYGIESAKMGGFNSKGEKDHAKLTYKSVIGGTIGKEFNLGTYASLLEASFLHAKADKYEYNGNTRDPEGRFNDLTTVSVMYYVGRTILPKKRVQIPIYIGLGGEVLQGYPFHHLMCDFGAKARIKFYFTNHIGIFAGATGKWGFGYSGLGEKGSESSTVSHNHLSVNFDAGLTFEL